MSYKGLLCDFCGTVIPSGNRDYAADDNEHILCTACEYKIYTNLSGICQGCEQQKVVSQCEGQILCATCECHHTEEMYRTICDTIQYKDEDVMHTDDNLTHCEYCNKWYTGILCPRRQCHLDTMYANAWF